VTPGGIAMSKHRLLEPLMPSLSCSPPSVCFACHLKKLPGKFDPVKAKSLGVKQGPLFGVLKHGNPVTLDDGTVVCM